MSHPDTYLPQRRIAELKDEPREHIWDPATHFCLTCGMARADAMMRNLACIADTTNVVAISHRARGRLMRSLHAAAAMRPRL